MKLLRQQQPQQASCNMVRCLGEQEQPVPRQAAGDCGAQLRSSVPVIHLSEETGQAAHLGPVAARAVGSKRGACSSAALGTLWLAAVDTDGA